MLMVQMVTSSPTGDHIMAALRDLGTDGFPDRTLKYGELD